MSSADLARVSSIAADQYGIVSLTQLQQIGLSRDRIARLVQTEMLVRVIDGAYRHTAHHDSHLGRCLAISLVRPGLVVGGPTAAGLWGFRRIPRDHRIHAIVKPHGQPGRVAWLRPYRTALIRSDDVTTRSDSIRLTTPARTVVDMMRHATTPAVISMIEQGIDQGWFSEQQVRETAEHTATPGRPFATKFLVLLERRLHGGPAGSDWESIVGQHLQQRGHTDLVRQHSLQVRGYGTLRFDLAVPSRRWALEIDVHPSHFSFEGSARDKFRDRCCAEIGWLVQRVGEPDLRSNLPETLDSIERTLAARPRFTDGLRPVS